jgi:P-type E1-E2 ATPase
MLSTAAAFLKCQFSAFPYRIDTIIFDKTGTLTEGKPAVVDVLALRPQRKGEPDTSVMLAI